MVTSGATPLRAGLAVSQYIYVSAIDGGAGDGKNENFSSSAGRHKKRKYLFPLYHCRQFYIQEKVNILHVIPSHVYCPF